MSGFRCSGIAAVVNFNQILMLHLRRRPPGASSFPRVNNSSLSICSYKLNVYHSLPGGSMG